MRLELLPLIAGVIFAVIGFAVVADAVFADGTFIPVERRRRARPERHRLGEACLGLGVICVGAALFGGDRWRYTTLAVVCAVVFLLSGLALNLKYLRGLTLGPIFGRSLKRRATDTPPDT
jgi:uncharacterized membrane protein